MFGADFFFKWKVSNVTSGTLSSESLHLKMLVKTILSGLHETFSSRQRKECEAAVQQR